MLSSLARVSCEIIKINLHCMLHIVERKHHGPLKCSSIIFNTKGNILVFEGSPMKNECCIMLVFQSNFDLVIPQKPSMNENILLPAHSSRI
jgi:hypothetical protein